ncbi:hypothetical protein [Streptomyces sp. NPDC001315]|uniref:hypothetical protein n=1 Tax=Streptomyces sp. NPDC001315 TaxID=3364562 RepID=UPI0036CDE728
MTPQPDGRPAATARGRRTMPMPPYDRAALVPVPAAPRTSTATSRSPHGEAVAP